MGITERKIQEKEKRRRDILKGARKVFFNKGYLNASMEMIAEAAQLSKGTIYLYYRSKDDLYITLLEDGLNLLFKMFAEAVKSVENVEDKLIRIAEAYYEFSIQYPEIFNILMEVNRDELIKTENVSATTLIRLREMEDKAINQVINVMLDGIDKDIFNSCYAVSQLWVSITGAIELGRRQTKPYIMNNVNTLDLIRDITKSLIIAHTTSNEIVKKYKKDIFNNAKKQAPVQIFNKKINEK